ncbi:hypothetical protein CMV_005126 [Castanea mollissima]|uniref:Uncharacterized protein n=1 Tax=Castanea mollissima TaxID=60419 RepID=A0A8J4W1T8_9ROSI|nr:hypothetical protein CMV_005126 [Castanea mollissima]
MSSRKRVLVVGGTGYLGQHILQFARLFRDPRHPIELDLAFTYHSNLPQPLLDVLPHLLAFHVDLKLGKDLNPFHTHLASLMWS